VKYVNNLNIGIISEVSVSNNEKLSDVDIIKLILQKSAR